VAVELPKGISSSENYFSLNFHTLDLLRISALSGFAYSQKLVYSKPALILETIETLFCHEPNVDEIEGAFWGHIASVGNFATALLKGVSPKGYFGYRQRICDLMRISMLSSFVHKQQFLDPTA